MVREDSTGRQVRASRDELAERSTGLFVVSCFVDA